MTCNSLRLRRFRLAIANSKSSRPFSLGTGAHKHVAASGPSDTPPVSPFPGVEVATVPTPNTGTNSGGLSDTPPVPTLPTVATIHESSAVSASAQQVLKYVLIGLFGHQPPPASVATPDAGTRTTGPL